MRTHAISIFIISALLCSASASFSFNPVALFLESFAARINYNDMNPTIENCSNYLNATTQAALSLMSRDIFDHLEDLIYSFGDNFAQTTHYCGKAAMLIPSMFQYFHGGVSNLTLKSFSSNILTNSYSINKNIFYLRYSVYRGLYDDSGEIVADLLKIALFGDMRIPVARQLFELDEFANINIVGFSSTLENHISSLLQGSQGFMDQTMASEYAKLLQDFSALLSELPALEKAIKSENFNTTIEATKVTFYKLVATAKNSVAFNQQLVAFLQKELSLFSDEQKMAKGVRALVDNLPTTLTNIQKIAAAYQNRNFQEVGKYIRTIFDQIRDGAMKN